MAAEPSGRPAAPPGLRVRGTPERLARVWGLVAPLQPVRWDGEGVVCAPRAADGGARVPVGLDWDVLDAVPGWPDPPALWLAGWYVRSPAHAPPPPGVRDLVLAPGDGFGGLGHPTTAMCLAALERLPAGPATDLGCGAGLLTQAWRRLGRGPVHAVDLDPAGVAQARASLEAAGLAAGVELVRGPAERAAAGLAGRVLLANVPAAVHASVHACMHAAPVAAVLSGLRPGEGRVAVDRYRRMGLRVRAAHRHGGWECWVLVL